MSNVANAIAPANAIPQKSFSLKEHSPVLTANERAALEVLRVHFASHGRQWPTASRKALARLLCPLYELLERIPAAKAPCNSVIHLVIVEMQYRGIAYWGWSTDDWLDVMCSSEAAFRSRYGGNGNCRQYVIAVAYLLCGFDRITEIGRFFPYRLAIKVFGREAVEHANRQVFDEMSKVGFKSVHRPSVSNALYTALLIQCSPCIEDLTLHTLQQVARTGAAFIRSGVATLSRTLVRLKLLAHGLDHRVNDRRRPVDEYRATDGIPDEWLQWCERWRATAVRAASSITGD